MKVLSFILVVIMNFIASSAPAGPFQYECTIERIIEDDGSESVGLLNMYKDDKVFIERDSGVILHPYFAQSKDQIEQSAVIHRGDSSSYYKAVSVTIAGFLIAVTVKEFDTSSKKPLALLEGGKVMTGYCY